MPQDPLDNVQLLFNSILSVVDGIFAVDKLGLLLE
jgi:hypothetical protein